MKKILNKGRNLIRKRLKNHLLRTEPANKPAAPHLEDVHLRTTQVLVNRRQLIGQMPKEGIAAEIGVARGAFSEVILEQARPRQLHLIDAWASDRYGEPMHREVLRKFGPQIGRGQVHVHHGRSTEVGRKFPDSYFDWIYLDTDHSYETTRAELELYGPKVKPDGFMAGHDFTKGNTDRWIRYGVIEAVFEFCVRHHWELRYMTMELDEYPSFAIRRVDW